MQSSVPIHLSIVLPAKNEAAAIGATVEKIHAQLLQMQIVGEIEVLVVNDGSTDDTAAVAQAAGARVVHHPYSKGNGAAIKTGARSALGEVRVFMDADGQHDPADIPRLLSKLNQGNDMVVGARQKGSQARVGRGLAHGLYNRLASWMTGHKVDDLTSGFRAVRGTSSASFSICCPMAFLTPPPAPWHFSVPGTRWLTCRSTQPSALAKATSACCAMAHASCSSSSRLARCFRQ